MKEFERYVLGDVLHFWPRNEKLGAQFIEAGLLNLPDSTLLEKFFQHLVSSKTLLKQFILRLETNPVERPLLLGPSFQAAFCDVGMRTGSNFRRFSEIVAKFYPEQFDKFDAMKFNGSFLAPQIDFAILQMLTGFATVPRLVLPKLTLASFQAMEAIRWSDLAYTSVCSKTSRFSELFQIFESFLITYPSLSQSTFDVPTVVAVFGQKTLAFAAEYQQFLAQNDIRLRQLELQMQTDVSLRELQASLGVSANSRFRI